MCASGSSDDCEEPTRGLPATDPSAIAPERTNRRDEQRDELLVQAMARSDGEALGALYDRFAGQLLAAGQRFLGGAREAEDLVHDVVLEAWHRAGHYDRTRGSVRTWLMLRLRSRALDWLLRSARRFGLVGFEETREPMPRARTPTWPGGEEAR